MEFIFNGSLKNIAKMDRVSISIDRPVPLKDLLGQLVKYLGSLVPYGAETTDAQLLANLSFFKGNQMLRIKDEIEPADQIMVLLPATGG
jgi:hypothetical protein